MGEMLRRNNGTRLFRFDEGDKRIVEVATHELPEVVRKYGAVESKTPKSDIDRSPDIPFFSERHSLLRRRWQRTRTRLLNSLRKSTPVSLAASLTKLTNYRRAARDILFRNNRRVSERSLPPFVFPPGHVCVSLSLTWGKPGYWEAIAEAKRNGARVITLIHDIVPILRPDWSIPDTTEVATEWVHKAAENADLLLVVSRFQKTEIERYAFQVGITIPPVEAVRLGDNPPRFQNPDVFQPDTMRAQACRFVLNVAGFYPRKNHAALYRVWRRLATDFGEQCPKLIMVGEKPRMTFDLLQQMQDDPLTRERIEVLFGVQDERLAWYFQHCLFTVYPSFYEGWGLPVAESLRLGRYCIASSIPSSDEIGGELIDYIDPANDDSIFNMISFALKNPRYVKDRELLIKRKYRACSWSDTTNEILGHIEKHKVAEAP